MKGLPVKDKRRLFNRKPKVTKVPFLGVGTLPGQFVHEENGKTGFIKAMEARRERMFIG